VAQKRSIGPDAGRSHKVRDLSLLPHGDLNVMLWTLLQCHCDDGGRWAFEREDLRWSVMPAWEHYSHEDFWQALEYIADVRLITLYRVDGRYHIDYHGFAEHQTSIKAANRVSALPGPEAADWVYDPLKAKEAKDSAYQTEAIAQVRDSAAQVRDSAAQVRDTPAQQRDDAQPNRAPVPVPVPVPASLPDSASGSGLQSNPTPEPGGDLGAAPAAAAPRPRRSRRTAGTDPEIDPRVHPVREHFAQRFRERFAVEYPAAPARDGALLKRIPTSYTTEQLVVLVDRFFATADPRVRWRQCDVPAFCSALPALIEEQAGGGGVAREQLAAAGGGGSARPPGDQVPADPGMAPEQVRRNIAQIRQPGGIRW
jgi:hypothetical protein